MKRLLVFLVLLAVGFTALRLALGDPTDATAGGGKAAPDLAPPSRSTGGDPIELQQKGLGIGVEIVGELQIEQTRLVETPTGTVRQTLYTLHADDCKPWSSGHLLEGVTIQFFDQGRPQATLTAQSAAVDLAVDENGRRTIRQDKEIELTNAVLETVPGTRFGPMRLEAQRMRVFVDEHQIALHTPEDDTPVQVTVGGERPGTLRGRGLQARIPRGPDTPLARMDVRILAKPEVFAEGIEVRADGALQYIEELRSGIAMLTAQRNVRIQLVPGALDGGLGSARPVTDPVSMHGDQLIASLQRTRLLGEDGKRREEMDWTQLRLLGSKAEVKGGGFLIHSPRLTIVPGPAGQPFLVNADGGESDVEQRSADGRRVATFHSTRPIRLVRPAVLLGGMHAAFGFPSGALGSLRRVEMLVFDGRAELDAGDGVKLSADRGLRIHRLDPQRENGAVVARGLGNVTIAQGFGSDRIVAIGDNGFLLEQRPDGDVLRLGEPLATAPQHFELRRGEINLRGTGNCRLKRLADGTSELSLASPDGSIEGSFGADLGRLTDAATLDATIAGKELLSFAATGLGDLPLALETTRGAEPLHAWAARLERIGLDAFRLSGTDERPARVVRPRDEKNPGGELLAPTIEIWSIGPDAVLVDARASTGRRAVMKTRFAASIGRKDADVAVDADRIRLVPYAVAPAALRMHLAGLQAGVDAVVGSNLAQAWILAEGNVVADLSDPEHGSTHAEGRLFVVSQGSQSGLLIGDGATGEVATVRNELPDGRSRRAEGARIRFFRAEGERLAVLPTFAGRSALHPPSIVFSDPRPDAGGDPLANLRAECTGEIEVLPKRVAFRGPVTAQGLRADGTADPDGIRISAEELTLERQPRNERETRMARVSRVLATGGASVDWRTMHAFSQNLEVDLLRQRCIVDDDNGAYLELGNGMTWRARRIEAFYVTWSVRSWHGTHRQTADTR